jgi:hypothetical protein
MMKQAEGELNQGLLRTQLIPDEMAHYSKSHDGLCSREKGVADPDI